MAIIKCSKCEKKENRKNRKIIIILTVALVFAFVLSACSDSEVNNVEKLIKNIGEVNELTGDYLQEIEQAYNALDDDQKEKVKNYEQYLATVAEYESFLRVIQVQNSIDSIKELSWNSKDIIDEIKNEYNSLTEEEKNKVKNYAQLESLEAAYEEYMMSTVEDAVDDLDYYSYNQHNSKAAKFNAYYDYMTDEQKKECLALYMFYEIAPGRVESKIKNSLKNPSSYTLYKMNVDSVITYDEDEDVFTGWIEITYGGTNSFGGMVKESSTAWVEFSVNIENKLISSMDITFWDF